MEFNEKAFARQKFRSSRGRGRGGRGGAHRAGQYSGGPARQAQRDLDSNAFRYEDEADKEDDGVVAPKSQGADLEALIEDADVQFNQAFYRFRSQLHDITEEVPPLGATRPEQLLAIDLEALAASLSALPLHELLGLEPEYLEGVEIEGSQGQEHGQGHGQQLSSSRPAVPVEPQPGRNLSTLPAMPSPAGAAPSVGAAQQPAPLLGATPALPRPGIPVPTPVPIGVAAAAGPAARAYTQVAVTPGSAAVPAPTASSAHDDIDEELNALLMGRAPQPSSRAALQQPATPSGAVPAAVAAAAGLGVARPSAAPVMPPALAAAMAAARPPQPTLAGQGADGPSRTAGGVGPGPGSATLGSATAAAQHGAARILGAVLSPAHAAPRAYSPALSLPASGAGGAAGAGGPVGVVRLAAAGSTGPSAIPVVATLAAAQPASVAAPSAADRGHTTQPAVAGLPSARLVGPPALAVAQQAASRAAAAAAVGGGGRAAGGSGPGGGAGGGGGAVVDDELRLLLGLPVEAAAVGGPKAGGPAVATTHMPTQVQPRPAIKAAPTVTLQPAAGRPGPPPTTQQPPSSAAAAAKSLDDWLNGL